MGLTHEEICKHVEICDKQKLPIVADIYRPFKNKRQRKKLPLYHELIRFQQQHGVITNRQFYYHLVQQPLGSPLRRDVSTTPQANSVANEVKELTVACRLGGLIPIDSIADDTQLLGTTQYNYSIEEFLINQLEDYRSNWFENQVVYVECWLEKRALERIFDPINDEYGVYLSVSGKYPSLAQGVEYLL